MGLDWCVQDKIIPGFEATLSGLEAQKGALSDELEERWQQFLEAGGHEQPHSYPNQITKEFNNLPAIVGRKEVLDGIKTQMAACVISAMDTLGTPRVSMDMADDVKAHAFGVYESHREARVEQLGPGQHRLEAIFSLHGRATAAREWLEMYPNFEAWISANLGHYLSDFPNDSPGIGKVTGIMVAPTSFRGKCIGYIDFLSDAVKESAYESKEPDDLAAYGRQIIEEVDQYEAEKNRSGEAKENSDLARSGGEWCIFWGEHGHGMYAWY